MTASCTISARKLQECVCILTCTACIKLTKYCNCCITLLLYAYCCSAVSGYIALLPPPSSFDTLLHWSDAELALLCAPRLAASATRQKAGRHKHVLHTQLQVAL
jgi:hypothetical protein